MHFIMLDCEKGFEIKTPDNKIITAPPVIEVEKIKSVNSAKLLSCPFCAGTPKQSYDEVENDYSVYCTNTNCGAIITGNSRAEADKNWNKRQKSHPEINCSECRSCLPLGGGFTCDYVGLDSSIILTAEDSKIVGCTNFERRVF